MLFSFVITRLCSLSSTSTPSPLSWVCSHIAILTFIPQFLLFPSFVSFDLFSIPFPSPTVTILPLCPDHLIRFLCNALMHSLDIIYSITYFNLLIRAPSSIYCTLSGLSINYPVIFESVCSVWFHALLSFLTCNHSPLHMWLLDMCHIISLHSLHKVKQTPRGEEPPGLSLRGGMGFSAPRVG